MTIGPLTDKEFGSDFHVCLKEDFLQHDETNIFFDKERFSLFFSGRSALYSLLKYGIEKYNWRKVYFPDYYCHEVIEFVRSLSIEIAYYEFNPYLDSEKEVIEVDDHEGNVIVTVLFFGITTPRLNYSKKAALIEDVTHNILAFKESRADYCIASLRKQLPVPCGGFTYSPLNKPLPHVKYNGESGEMRCRN